MNVESMTPQEFLALEEAAIHGATNGREFDELQRALDHSPQIAERLVFQLLEFAVEGLKRSENPGRCLLPAIKFGGTVSQARLSDYTSKLERVILSCFDSMAICGDNRFALSLVAALAALRAACAPRYDSLLAQLKELCRPDVNDSRRRVLAIFGCSGARTPAGMTESSRN